MPPSPASARTPKETNVFLFIPNLIGYTRIILAILALYLLPTNPFKAMISYSISSLLDAVDGHAARYFNQTTKFGSVLDMVTDRSATSCLLVHLAVQYPPYAILFQLLIALDLSSHYMHMYMSLTLGASSHKTLRKEDHWLLRLYYSNSTVLFLVCAGDQLLFISAYLLGWRNPLTNRPPWEAGSAGEMAAYAVFWLMLPVCVLKQALNVIQLVRASQGLASQDREARLAAAAASSSGSKAKKSS
ncbi:CDP-alcohol phosphatidyltransferase-domain-containing protein [Cladochytrium replicatum]|nr:CDP-alcohol phosphatidyltransferase-domain-containing protein [Cladochytrium replicatum]